MSTVDFAEVLRTAHQLALDHGHGAYLYAAKLAREASAAGRQDEAEFWKRVSAALTPRDT
jgi:hypothetical protein